MNRSLAIWMCLLTAIAFAIAADDGPKVAAPAGSEPAATQAAPAKDKDKAPLTVADQLAVSEALAPALVRVEYTLKSDKGESPSAHGHRGGSADDYIREERPLETSGMLIAPDQVVIADLMTHPRFVKSIAVRFGEELVQATPGAYAVEQNAVFLKLAKPLAKAKPLKFDPKAQGPYLTVSYYLSNAAWTTSVRRHSTSAAVSEHGRKWSPVRSGCVITDEKGTPVALSMISELPPDDSWKGSPLKWKTISAEERAKLLTNVEKLADESIVRVAISFRSPKKERRTGYSSRDEDDGKTERNVPGILVSDKQVLALISLKPSVTARLERIVIHPAAGEPIGAKFAHTLTDYGALIANLDKPLPRPAKLAKGGILKTRHSLLLAAEVRVRGENRVAYFNHTRMSYYSLGWKRRVYPHIPGGAKEKFVFDTSGRLVALPIARREKVSVEQSWSSGEPVLTAADDLRAVLADLDAHTDDSNKPLAEQEENRLAWIGVVLQPLNRELARHNKVSKLTRDGRIGAFVQYVYKDSPADEADVKVGWILLRLQAQGQPKPLEVRVDSHRIRGKFPWDKWDQLPEDYYDVYPRPWPGAGNKFARDLTQLGFGKKFTAKFFHEGKIIEKDFVVTQSPAHYDMAPKYKSEPLGFTVKEMTYEVKQYFHWKPNQPGLVLSKIERGSKASVAGLKPYEIITHVDGKPVTTVKGFEKLLGEASGELRLSVMCWTKARLASIRMAPKAKGDAKPPPTGG